MQRARSLTYAVGRPGRICSGMGLGVLLVEEEYPAFPGDVRNPSAYPYPIQYEIVEGLSLNLLLHSGKERDKAFPEILRAAKRLRRLGVRAIVGECGHFSYFQRRLAAELDIPVFISSLLQLPLAKQVIGPTRRVGVVVNHTKVVTDDHLEAVGAVRDSRTALRGLFNDGSCPAFEELWGYTPRAFDPPQVCYEDAEAQLVDFCRRFVEEEPELGALLLECTGYPPFARAVQRAVDLPVYSFTTLMDFAYSVVAHRDFYGHV